MIKLVNHFIIKKQDKNLNSIFSGYSQPNITVNNTSYNKILILTFSSEAEV